MQKARSDMDQKVGWKIRRSGWFNESWQVLRAQWDDNGGHDEGQWLFDYPFPAAAHFPSREFAETVMRALIAGKDWGDAVRPLRPESIRESYDYDFNGDPVK